jgi:hypothetical protein
MDSSELKIPEYYIAKKENGKEQIVKYYQKYVSEHSDDKYWGYYGINSYHDVVTSKKNMRELTEEEHRLFSEKKYWSLPQEFYHSFPVC